MFVCTCYIAECVHLNDLVNVAIICIVCNYVFMTTALG